MSGSRKKKATTETETETQTGEETETEKEEEKGQKEPARGRLQRVWFLNALLTCQQRVRLPTRC